MSEIDRDRYVIKDEPYYRSVANEVEGLEPISDPYQEWEWDYHEQLARPDWATVIERKQGRGNPEIMDGILTKYKRIKKKCPASLAITRG